MRRLPILALLLLAAPAARAQAPADPWTACGLAIAAAEREATLSRRPAAGHRPRRERAARPARRRCALALRDQRRWQRPLPGRQGGGHRGGRGAARAGDPLRRCRLHAGEPVPPPRRLPRPRRRLRPRAQRRLCRALPAGAARTHRQLGGGDRAVSLAEPGRGLAYHSRVRVARLATGTLLSAPTLRGLCAPGRQARLLVAPNGRPRLVCRA